MAHGIAIFRTYAEIKGEIERGTIEADSRWLVMPQSGGVSGATRRETVERTATPTGANGLIVERRTIETTPDTIERENAEGFRDAIPAAIRACGSQIAPNQPFVVPGSALADLVARIDRICDNARDFNAGSVFVHVETPVPAFIPVDPASLAGIVNVLLTDKLATIRRVIKGGMLPAVRGAPGYGEANLNSIFTSSAYKGIERLAPTPSIADTIKTAIVEARHLADAIWQYAEPKGSAARSAADVGAFAAGLVTRCLDSAIAQIAPPGHPVWAEITVPTVDPADALATPGDPGASGAAAEVSDLGSLL